MDIDNVSNTCLSCYSVNTLKAGTVFHQALPPYYDMLCGVFPWNFAGHIEVCEGKSLRNQILDLCAKYLACLLVPLSKLRNVGASGYMLERLSSVPFKKLNIKKERKN